MSYNFPFYTDINLYVKDRISETDATRQSLTAQAILERLKDQPGLILADEVGMGKTFVALAVATSIFLRDKKPVVIMIPPNLFKKWPNDFKLFCDACITDPAIKSKLKYGLAKRPEEFLRLLDDQEENRCAVVFLTHGALARNMSDGWIKLAIIQKALFRRHDTRDLYRVLSRYAGSLLEMGYLESKNREIDVWGSLLDTDISNWRKFLIKHQFVEVEFDDPVPLSFKRELDKVSTNELDKLYWYLKNEMPKRDSDNIKQRLRNVRQTLNEEAKKIWTKCLSSVKFDLPLLIFDEAHHLKNSQTQLVSKLFHNPEAEEDAGILKDQFERMLFLTATPFQLGHQELFNVLQRFETINWNSSDAPFNGIDNYKKELEILLKSLDDSQIAARKLDSSWGKLTSEDLVVSGATYTNTFDWWKAIQLNDSSISIHAQKVLLDYNSAKQKLKAVEPLLKKYVIRHLKPREMTDKFAGIKRRDNLPGNLILNEIIGEVKSNGGLSITQETILPFLLSARLTTIQQDRRPVFAEGLASSFEAFRFTREERFKREKQNRFTDTDDDVDEMSNTENSTDGISNWYLDQLDSSLSSSAKSGSQHPKIKPTVDKAIELWTKREKVLIFCHYIATGKALRKYISEAMKQHISEIGSDLLDCKPDEVFDRLEKLADKITDKDSRLSKKITSELHKMIDQYEDLKEFKESIVDFILRYMRTPSFLIRFAEKGDIELNENWLESSFKNSDNSGVTFSDMILNFLKFLNNRKEDREDYIAALKSIQIGGIRTKDITVDFEGDENEEGDSSNPDIVMANVRLCYGATSQELRQKLMKTFNTPFFPDILITSSVMAEGVDLQLSCRHIIHHDLCWNPSTLEQRTGRVDRIGSKSEMCGKSIQVYMPYISETQDEKMYRVVTERERWFNIVMGEKYKVDAGTTDKYADRISLPEELAKELAFHLEVI